MSELNSVPIRDGDENKRLSRHECPPCLQAMPSPAQCVQSSSRCHRAILSIRPLGGASFWGAPRHTLSKPSLVSMLVAFTCQALCHKQQSDQQLPTFCGAVGHDLHQWRGGDLNSQPRAYESPAPPLSYLADLRCDLRL